MSQRAVGLGYGILLPSDDRNEPWREDIELRAYDLNGHILPASVSDGLQTTNQSGLARDIETHRMA